MIRHEAVAQQAEIVKLRILSQQLKVGDAIGIAGENDLSRIATLRNMVSNAGDHDTRESSHSKKLTEMIGRRMMDGLSEAWWFPDREEKTGVRPVCPQVSTYGGGVVAGAEVVEVGFGIAFFAGELVAHRVISIDTQWSQTPIAIAILISSVLGAFFETVIVPITDWKPFSVALNL